MNTLDKKSAWARYYENHKKLWFDPTISIYEKAIVQIVELHRSDSKGWSLSVRRMANLLGISSNTVLQAVQDAISHRFIEVDTSIQRKRRKLRLSVSLRTPTTHEIINKNLSHTLKQAVSERATESVSPRESVNIKSNIKQIGDVSEKERKPFKGKNYEYLRGAVNKLRRPPV